MASTVYRAKKHKKKGLGPGGEKRAENVDAHEQCHAADATRQNDNRQEGGPVPGMRLLAFICRGHIHPAVAGNR